VQAGHARHYHYDNFVVRHCRRQYRNAATKK